MVFVDTNIWTYAFLSQDRVKLEKALDSVCRAMTEDAKLPQAIPPTNATELHMWLRMLYQVVREQREEMKKMQNRIKELEDSQNG